MPLQEFDRRMLARTLELAELGRGSTRPNPMVGAVIVRDGQVLGEGYHRAAGQDHAEVAAIKAASGGSTSFDGRLRGSTVYVSLEPCVHFGRTPPCTELLIQTGVARVVVAAVDPSEKVAGKGIERLRKAGIQVELENGEIGRRARRQNDPFRTWAVTGRPFVTYKYAMTLDGCVATATGHSRWISGEESRREVHGMRAAADAIVVGSGTLLADDPQLTARDVPVVEQPLRVVVDGGLTITRESALVRTIEEGPVLCICGPSVPAERRRQVEGWGVEVVALETAAEGRLDPNRIGRYLGQREIQQVLLEGGPRLAAGWWRAAMVDRLIAFVAPLVVGGDGLSPFAGKGPDRMHEAGRLLDVTSMAFGQDLMISGYVREPY